MADQINVFVENKKGRLGALAQTLADHHINIRALVIQDRGEYGMIKLLVDDPPRARAALSAAGLTSAVKHVLAVVISDAPGGLCALAQHMAAKGINLLDAYGFVLESKKTSVICAEVGDLEKARAAIEEGGFRVLSDRELYEL